MQPLWQLLLGRSGFEHCMTVSVCVNCASRRADPAQPACPAHPETALSMVVDSAAIPAAVASAGQSAGSLPLPVAALPGPAPAKTRGVAQL